jgi:hypothetical protein
MPRRPRSKTTASSPASAFDHLTKAVGRESALSGLSQVSKAKAAAAGSEHHALRTLVNLSHRPLLASITSALRKLPNAVPAKGTLDEPALQRLMNIQVGLQCSGLPKSTQLLGVLHEMRAYGDPVAEVDTQSLGNPPAARVEDES